MPVEGQIGVDTQDLRASAETSQDAAIEFVKSYDELKDWVENSGVTGPVYDAAVNAIHEKEGIVEDVRRTLNENADYAVDKADEGDRVIDNLVNETR